MTTPELEFRRRRHLALACVALLHAPLVMAFARWLWRQPSAATWTVTDALLSHALPLACVAVLAWLAFVRFDTHAGVRVFPVRWRDLGVGALGVFVVAKLGQAVVVFDRSPQALAASVAIWGAPFIQPDGGLLFGALVLAELTIALAEELVYRALLLRALEGYVDPRLALLGQALVFELVHAHVYGLGPGGGFWFALGLLFGHAFARTRSLAVPVLLHAAWNISYVLLLWLAWSPA